MINSLFLILYVLIRVSKSIGGKELTEQTPEEIKTQFYVSYDAESTHIKQDNIEINLSKHFIHAIDIKIEQSKSGQLCTEMTSNIVNNFAYSKAIDKFKKIEEFQSDKNEILSYYLEEYEQNKIYESILWKPKQSSSGKDTNIPRAEETFLELPNNERRDSLQNLILQPNTFQLYIIKDKDMYAELIRGEETTGSIKERCMFRLSKKTTNAKDKTFRRITLEEFEVK